MKRKLPAAVYALGATSLLNDAAGDMVYPLLPVFLATTLGAGATALGMIEGAADALSSVLKLVSGHVSDRMRRRKPLVIIGYALASAARPLVAFAGTTLHVLLVRLADRFGKGVRSSPRDALIADITPPALHGRAFGVHEAMDHAGAVFGPLLAYGLLAGGWRLTNVFLFSAVPAVLACLVLGFFVREPARVGERASAEALARERNTEEGVVRVPPTEVPYLTRPFRGYLAAVTLFALGNSSDAFLLLRVHDAGLPTAMVPLLWGGHNLVKAVLSAAAGGLADRLGRRRALAAGWLVYAAIYGGFAFATSTAVIIALFIGYGVHFALVAGAQRALVAELVPATARARGFGAYHVCVGLAALPASLLFGFLYETVGVAAAFLTGAGLALVAVAALPLSREARRV